MKTVTIDSILGEFEKHVADGTPVSPGLWLDGAAKLVSLMGSLDDELIDAELKYRNIRTFYIDDDKTAAEAEARAKSSEAYRNYLHLKAKKERIQEFINISKKRVGLTEWQQ